MSFSFKLCVTTSQDPLGKAFRLDATGGLCKVVHGGVTRGVAKIHHCRSIAEYLQLRCALTGREAFTYGLPAHSEACVLADSVRRHEKLTPWRH